MEFETDPQWTRELLPQDWAMLCLLAEIPVHELDDESAIQEMINGRQELRTIVRCHDFGFDVVSWHRYLTSTPMFQSTYRREWIAEKLKEWVPSIAASDRYQALCKIAEERWNKNPPEPKKPTFDFGSIDGATLVQQMINHEGPFDPRNIRRMQDENKQ